MPKLIDVAKLFDATLAVFAENGYAGTATREIAERAGVNEVTIFRRYGTKAGLVNAAFEHRLATTPFAALEVGADVTADLRGLVEAFTATTQALGGAVATLLTDAGRHPELRPAMIPLLVNLRGAVQVLQAHQDSGALRREDPWQQLLGLLAPVLAAGLWARSGVAPPAHINPGATVDGFLHGHRR
jgi:AcrR family transcriptional regulator